MIAGAVVAAATTLLLSLLGTAFGLASIQDFASTPGETTTSGVGAGIWTIINLALSMVLGGYVASRLSGIDPRMGILDDEGRRDPSRLVPPILKDDNHLVMRKDRAK